MEIRFHFDEVTAEAAANWKEFLVRCAANVDLDPLDVDTVHVATSDGYAAVLQMLLPDVRPGRTHTDNDFYRGVAKTLLPVDGRSSVVVHDFVMVAAANYIDRLAGAAGPMDAQQAYEQEMFWYVLHHEFGHCFDHKHRPPEPMKSYDNWLDEVEDRYTSLMASEVAACALSAGAMTTACFERLLRDDREVFENLLQKLQRQTITYRISHTGLAELASSVAEAYWVIITQCAKHIATATAHEALAHVWAASKERVEQSVGLGLAPLAQAVSAFLTSYPSARIGHSGTLRKFWAEACLAAGYRFEIDGEQIAMWLE